MFPRIAILVGVIGVMLAMVTASAQPPDTLWTQTYGGMGSDEGHSVQQTGDGGYIITGWTTSYGAGDEDIYLIKTDASGIQQWSRTFGGTGWDRGESVQQSADGGYIIVGSTSSYGAGSADVYLIKTDSSGLEQWSQTFGGSSSDCGYSVQQTVDGGYIIAGFTGSYGVGGDVYLIKTGNSGNQQWSLTFGGSSCDVGHSIYQTSDGGFIIAGWTWSLGSDSVDVYLIKTLASGIEQWSRTFGGSNDDRGYSVQQTRDGGYIISGYSGSYGAGGKDVYLIKTDSSGMEQWSQNFGGSDDDVGLSVQQTSDGGYIIAGSTYSYGAGYSDVYLIKTNASGIEQWSQTFGGSFWDECHSFDQTSDGGCIIAGYTVSYGAGSTDVWLIRLESGQSNVTLSLIPLNPPIQIPAGGGSLSFFLEIYNGVATNYIIDVSTDVTLPGGTTYNLLSREGINLASGASLTRNLTQFVPAGAPAGNYAYNGYVYDHTTGELLAEDSFPFEKLTGYDFPDHKMGWALFGWDDEEEVSANPPGEYASYQVFPNPFNATTTIRFDLPAPGWVKLEVFDVAGRVVGAVRQPPLHDQWLNAGTHQITFDASALASGIYIYRLSTGEFTASGKMVLMK